MEEFTIDELAREAGMTVRNVRSYQTRGLLPGPGMRGRVGVYGPVHLERLELIKSLQADGLPLGLVERVLSGDAEAAERLVALRGILLEPAAGAATAEPETITAAELEARYGVFDEDDIARSERLGTVVRRPDGDFELRWPALLIVLARVMAHGVSLKGAIKAAEAVQRASADAARAFVEMVTTELFPPQAVTDRPEDWPHMMQTIEALRPAALLTFDQMVPPAIDTEIERVVAEQLRQQAQADS